MDLFSALLTLLVALVEKCYAEEWSYHNKDLWPTHFAPACNGTHQSPINIDTLNVIFHEKTLKPIEFNTYDKALEVTEFVNDGHTVQVNLKATTYNPSISGGGFPDSYIFAQFHFHWGSKNSEGAEHTINMKTYPAEIHLVHFRQDLKSLRNAADKPNGLAVLGALLEICDNDNPDLEIITASLQKIIYQEDKIYLNGSIYLNKFLPKNTDRFYRYHGSLTTPLCYESVIWTLFDDKLRISERQLIKFRELYEYKKDETGKLHIQDNFRKVQPLNNRPIQVSFKRQENCGHYPNSVYKTMVVIIICIILTKLWC